MNNGPLPPEDGRNEDVYLDSLDEPGVGENEKQRERLRGLIALLLLGLLGFEIVFSLAAIWWQPDKLTVPIQDWLKTVLTPTVALLGAATGFYYGTRSGN